MHTDHVLLCGRLAGWKKWRMASLCIRSRMICLSHLAGMAHFRVVQAVFIKSSPERQFLLMPVTLIRVFRVLARSIIIWSMAP